MKNKSLQFALLMALALTPELAANEAVAPHELKLEEVSDTKVDDVVTIVGKWGNYIHGKSYQQEAIVTHKNWQYTIYYNADRKLSLARRALPSGKWEVIAFEDYTFHGDDNHNVPVIGICPADGTIHLAFDLHGHPLRYRVSAKNAASNPEKTPWEPALFGPVTDYLVPGKPLSGLTYPCFVTASDNTMYFFYRVGNPHDGRIFMSRYDPSAGGWAESWQITDSAGDYEFDGKKSNSRNAYLNNPCVDHNGRIHLSWIWREGGALSNAQHDLCFAYSDDGGKTFRNHLGEVASNEAGLVGIDSPDITIWPINPKRGLKNQQAMAVDGDGRPHIVLWYLSDLAADIGIAAKDHGKSRYHHFRRAADGKWHKQELPYELAKDEWVARSHLAFGSDDRLFHIFNRDGKITIAAATGAGDFRDWHLVQERDGGFTGEAKADIHRLRRENILSVYMHESPRNPGDCTSLHVVDFKIND